MGDLLWQMGKLDDAIAEYEQALLIKHDFHISAGKIAYIHAMKEDYAGAHKWLDKAIDISPTYGTKAIWNWVKSWMHYWCGNLQQSLVSLDETYKLAVKENNSYIIAGTLWLRAFMELDEGKTESAETNFRKAVDIFLSLTTTPSVDSASYYIFKATVSIKQDYPGEAAKHLEQAKRMIANIDPTDVDFITYWYSQTSIRLLLSENNFQAAVEKGKLVNLPVLPGFTFPEVLIYNIPMHHDFMALAYINLNLKPQAIAEYERIIAADPSIPDRRLIHPDYRYRLAKLYEETGEKQKAIEQYRKVLEIWKEADKSMPAKNDARERLAALSGRSGRP